MKLRTVPAAGVPTTVTDIARTLAGCSVPRRTEAFAGRFAEYTGMPYCIPVWSGRSAMYLALKALASLHPGRSEVLIPALTCESVYYAVLRAGLKPVLYDIDPDTLGTPRAGGADKLGDATLCLVCSTLFGIPVDVEAACGAARERGIPVIEDVAQSFGARCDGRLLGTFGDVSVFSFGKSKNMTTVHGGMVATADARIADALGRECSALERPSLREQLGILALLGVNTVIIRPFFFNLVTLLRIPFVDSSFSVDFKVKRMGGIQAALGSVMLEKLDGLNGNRRANAAALNGLLGSVPGLQSVPARPDEGGVYLRFPVAMAGASEAEAAVNRLKAAGIWAGLQAYRPLYELTGEGAGAYPVTAGLHDRVVAVPSHPFMTARDVAVVGDVLTGVVSAPSPVRIRAFLDGLKDEREFFFFDTDRIISSELLIPHYIEGEMAGLCGIYRMQRLPTFFIVVKTGFQGRGIARKLMAALRSAMDGRRYPFAVLTVHRLNRRAVRLYEGAGYLTLGMIGPVRYMVLPLRAEGQLVRWALWAAFPLIRALRIRKHRAWEAERVGTAQQFGARHDSPES